ncbi:MAG: ATP-binding cassette domain-containing protein [Candidatus Omnitrophota bacterium]|nr:ATP-binding cassette domain-containing protein [Candidatus Omnitrophota bacterium]
MIDVQSLTMHYGSFTALDGVSFQVREGEILGLLGPNGAGKTTCMRILTTYLYPSSGTVKINNHDILEKPIEVRRATGYLPETAPLYTDMRTDEYLAFVGRARGLRGDELKNRLNWVQKNCQVQSVWKHTLSQLSKGYRQRVGLAQALIHDPKILILDEPTSGLDPLQILGIRDLIRSLAAKKTIIFSTHILREVEVMADRIVIINEGKIVAVGTQQELAEQVKIQTQTHETPHLEDIFIELLKPRHAGAIAL